MSGPARTAEVTVMVQVKITDTATEGEMLDAVLTAVRGLTVELQADNGSAKILRSNNASVVTISTGGHL